MNKSLTSMFIKSVYLWLLVSLSLYATQPLKYTQEATTDSLALMYSIEGDIEQIYNNFVEKKLVSVGFHVTHPHKRVNDQYKAKWGSSKLDLLSFLSTTNDKNLLPLLNIDPRLASFAPFNMLIYKKSAQAKTHVGHILPSRMLEMIGIEDVKVKQRFIDSFKPLDTLLEKELKATKLPIEKYYIQKHKDAKKQMMNFVYKFERPDDIDDFTDAFQNDLELAFINQGYLIAGFHDFKEDDEDDVLEGYDMFWSWSLCHLEYSYNMFDNAGARPEAGLFAPCTMFAYIKEGSNQVIFGMPTLDNWLSTLNITSPKRVTLAQKLDRQIPHILKTFGFRAIQNINPLDIDINTIMLEEETPTKLEKTVAQHNTNTTQGITETVPKVVKESENKTKVTTADAPKVKTYTIDGKQISVKVPTAPSPLVVENPTDNTIKNLRSIKFSKRIPPNWKPHSFNQESATSSEDKPAGEINGGRLSAYLLTELLSLEVATQKLKEGGFTILSQAKLDKKGLLTSVVFTNEALLAHTSKKNRGFASTLRLIVNQKENQLSITNPLYMLKGMMQNDYDEKVANTLLATLHAHFSKLKNAKEKLKANILDGYKFMKGMPRYEQMLTVATGTNLVEQAKQNSKVLFTKKLNNGATVLGIDVSKRTKKFTKRIGTNGVAILPYTILIEDGSAKILDPKYYLAFMYPLLQMSEFMTIATVPDDIKKECENIFK